MSVELVNERQTVGNGAGRRKGMRRAWLALPVAAVLLMAGCGSDDDKDDKAKETPAVTTSAAPTPAAPTPAGTVPAATPPAASTAPAATLTGEEKKVADSWDKLFDNTAPLAERKASLENADKVGTLVETLAADPMAKSISSKTTAVKIAGDKATVTYDIVAGGEPMLPGQTGQAVKQNGAWKVSLDTVCSLVGLLKQGAEVEGCPKA